MTLRGHLRAVLRIAVLIPVTVVMYLVLVIGLVVCGRQRRSSLRHWSFRNWARAFARICGLRHRARGKPPDPPFFLVCNHLGYMDVILLGAYLDCVFIAKSDIEDWPLANRLCRAVGTIFVNRGSRKDILRVNREIAEALQTGNGIILFPEGTSTDGSQVRRFKPSLLEMAVRSGIPVDYCCLSYRTPPGEIPASLSVCWWGDMNLLNHVYGMLALPGYEATIEFGEAPVSAIDRKELAQVLRRAVDEILPPVSPIENARDRAPSSTDIRTSAPIQ